jgi:hypothetical protein
MRYVPISSMRMAFGSGLGLALALGGLGACESQDADTNASGGSGGMMMRDAGPGGAVVPDAGTGGVPVGGAVVPDAGTGGVPVGGAVVPDAGTGGVPVGGAVVPDAGMGGVPVGGAVVPDAGTGGVPVGGAVVPDAGMGDPCEGIDLPPCPPPCVGIEPGGACDTPGATCGNEIGDGCQCADAQWQCTVHPPLGMGCNLVCRPAGVCVTTSDCFGHNAPIRCPGTWDCDPGQTRVSDAPGEDGCNYTCVYNLPACNPGEICPFDDECLPCPGALCETPNVCLDPDYAAP